MERWGQELISGVRCLLRASGLDERFWSLAIVYWTLAYNLQSNENLPDNKSPMELRFPNLNPKHYKLLAFGSAICFRPAPSTEAEKAVKWAGRGIQGILVGYHVQSVGL